MTEIQIRGLTSKKAELITNLLACLCDGFESEIKAYKNEFNEDVTEVYMPRLNRKMVSLLRAHDKILRDD